MAEQKPKDVAASKQADPTIKSGAGGEDYPEGTHPARPVEEVTHAAEKNEYKDMPEDEKPSKSSVVQVQVLSGDEATSG